MKIVVLVRVETPVHPTENVTRVRTAILNLFPDMDVEDKGASLIGVGEAMDTFRDLVRNQKIRDTAREVLIHGRRGKVTTFRLSKQAAFVGRVNFASNAPLGDLTVTVEDEDLDGLIDRVAESTVGRRLKTLDHSADK